jgi:hypothetical protein
MHHALPYVASLPRCGGWPRAYRFSINCGMNSDHRTESIPSSNFSRPFGRIAGSFTSCNLSSRSACSSIRFPTHYSQPYPISNRASRTRSKKVFRRWDSLANSFRALAFGSGGTIRTPLEKQAGNCFCQSAFHVAPKIYCPIPPMNRINTPMGSASLLSRRLPTAWAK